MGAMLDPENSSPNALPPTSRTNTWTNFTKFTSQNYRPLKRQPELEDLKDLGLDRASRLAPLTLLHFNLSLSRFDKARVVSGSKESPATAFVICANRMEGEKKNGSQSLSEGRLDDRSISQ